jgi:glycosyltransferase involved in cell wall biosynthesis
VRVAFVTPYLPYPLDGGGKIRSFHLLQGLARGHDVDLYTVHYGAEPDVPPAVRAPCRSVFSASLTRAEGSWPRAWRSLRPFSQAIDHFQGDSALREVRGRLGRGGYDLLLADELCMTPYVVGLPARKLAGRQKIEHRHHAALLARAAPGVRTLVGSLDLMRLRRFEWKSMAAVDAAVCCSEDDAARLRRLNPETAVAVVANGVDPDCFQPQPDGDGPPTLAYVGTMDYPPNVDALEYFFREIHPRLVRVVPDVKTRIVGRSPTPAVLAWGATSGVTVTGSVPDIRPHLAEATAVIVPLRIGGGTRIKILECLAAGRAVVSTSIGAEGLGLRHGEQVLLADDPESFATHAAALLRDRALRERLAAAGRSYVLARYSWSELGRRFAEICARVAATGTP